VKTCSHCHIEKEDSEFRMRREFRRKGGGPLLYLNNVCKACDVLIANKYYSHHKDDPKFKDQWLKKSRDYYNANKEKIKEKMKAKRQTPEYKAMMKEYREKHKDKIKADGRKRNLVYVNRIKKEVSPKYIDRLKLTNEYQLKRPGCRGKNPSYNNSTELLQARVIVNRIKRTINDRRRNKKGSISKGKAANK
jgi:hypothetical protein